MELVAAETVSRLYETRTARLELDPLGFIRATVKPGASMELEDAHACLSTCREKLSPRGRVPVLVDTRLLRYQSKACREALSGPYAALFTLRVAILTGSAVSRMVANFFMRHTLHLMPTQMFSDEVSAIHWLLNPEKP